MIRDGVVVATRVGPGAIADPGDPAVGGTFTPVPEGAHSYTARQLDPAGNASNDSPALVVTIDRSVAVPDAPALQPASDTGTVGDNITSVTAPVFDVSGVEAGATLELLRATIDPVTGQPGTPAVVQTLNNVVGGTIAISGPGTPGNGTYRYSARQTDRAGNAGAAGASVDVTILTGTPAVPSAPNLQAASDTGNSDTDNLTGAPRPVFDVNTTVGGVVVELYRNGVLVGSTVAPTPGTVAITDYNGGTAAAPGPLPTSGTYTYTAKTADAAGNRSAEGPSLSVTIDRDAPVGPLSPTLQAASDTGDVGDNLTSVTRPTFDVGGVEPGAIVTLLRRLAGTTDVYQAVGSATVAAGKTSVAVPDPGPLANNTSYEYTARQVDAAGNNGPVGGTQTITVQTSAPSTPPRPALQDASNSGSKADAITNAGALSFDVSPLPNDPSLTVTLLRRPAGAAGAFTEVASTPASGAVVLTDVAADGLADGLYQYIVRLANQAGASTDSPALVVTIDRTAPAAPALVLLRADDTGTVGDGRTTLRRPRLVGTTEAGSSIALFRNGVAGPIGSTTSAAVGGGFTIQPGAAPLLRNGAYTFTAQVTDAAGNVSAVGAPRNLTLYSAADDYDGDGRADLSLYRPASVAGGTGLFIILPSGGGPAIMQPLGAAGDVPLRGDFDGDGKADPATFNPVTATWTIQRSTDGRLDGARIGTLSNVLPLEADFDGDGRTDLAAYAPQYALWVIQNSGDRSTRIESYGDANSQAIPADFDGDGKADLAAYWPSQALWAVRYSNPANGPGIVQQLGWGGVDQAAPADFNGDGKADLAVYRPTNSTWYIRGLGAVPIVNLNGAPPTTTGIPLTTDFNGDGKADPGLYDPAGAWWYWQESTTKAPRARQFGAGTVYGGNDRAMPSPLGHRLPSAGVGGLAVRRASMPVAAAPAVVAVAPPPASTAVAVTVPIATTTTTTTTTTPVGWDAAARRGPGRESSRHAPGLLDRPPPQPSTLRT